MQEQVRLKSKAVQLRPLVCWEPDKYVRVPLLWHYKSVMHQWGYLASHRMAAH